MWLQKLFNGMWKNIIKQNLDNNKHSLDNPGTKQKSGLEEVKSEVIPLVQSGQKPSTNHTLRPEVTLETLCPRLCDY